MNIESIVINALDEILSVPVSADVPKDRPKSFVTVERTGGGKNGVTIDNATLAVQSWDTSRSKASTLAETVDTAMLDLAKDGTIISSVTRDAGPYNFPDPDGKSARYQGVYDIIFHNEY
jgi:hypothetical protein